ncbi:MAG: lytic murein transglycosylase [Gammaproteobacteria bacterium]
MRHLAPISLLLAGQLAFAAPLPAAEPAAAAEAPGAEATAAQAIAAGTAAFPACVADLMVRAEKKGISKAVIDSDLANVKFLPKVIELDRQQPEFVDSFANYFSRRLTDARIARGRELYAQHRDMLDGVAKQYGVPAQYLLAFWGLETNYGGFFGNTPVLDSLATLGCDTRRSRYFTDELINALRIIDEGSVTAARMQGSWAGAMGHVQFMPTTFLRYAVDHDGDGRRDLWGSLPDAMASAANFLRSLGWEDEARWGDEVLLPEGFPYEKAGLDEKHPLKKWKKLGVTLADGSALPASKTDASLLVPTGHAGPALLVQKNFRVIMRWNRSQAYALAVGHLADRIAGGGPLTRAPVDAPRLSREQIIALQDRLNELGFHAGKADGVLGSGTRGAIARWQKSQGLVADGFHAPAVLEKLGEPR